MLPLFANQSGRRLSKLHTVLCIHILCHPSWEIIPVFSFLSLCSDTRPPSASLFSNPLASGLVCACAYLAMDGASYNMDVDDLFGDSEHVNIQTINTTPPVKGLDAHIDDLGSSGCCQ